MTAIDHIYLRRCDSYDAELLYLEIKSGLSSLGFENDFFSGKRIVIKPNLVRRMDASSGGTTHPNMICAVTKLLLECGAASVTIAESPGGPYNAAALRSVYRGCGLDPAVVNAGAVLNTDCDCVAMPCPEGRKTKIYNIIKPVADADIVINIAKLKAHGLTKLTAAVKNFFGCIPGTEKVEMHARFPERSDFGAMLVDLCHMLCGAKPTLHIVDAIVAMEGNGPTNGSARSLGYFMMGRNPFALDALAADLVGFSGTVPMLEDAKRLGYYPAVMNDREVLGDSPESVRVSDFKAPDADAAKLLKLLPGILGGRINRALQPKPCVIADKCVGCGECVRSCPMKTIALNSHHKASINVKTCIRCYCCQELCPRDAIKIKKNILLKIIN